jgi:hypothetical protein
MNYVRLFALLAIGVLGGPWLALSAPADTPDEPCATEMQAWCQDVDPSAWQQLEACLRAHEAELTSACRARMLVNTFLGQMSAYLQETSQFAFEAEFTEEDVLESGQKLQFEGTVQLLLRRPDKLRLDTISAREKQRFWYDGKNIILQDKHENVYAVAAAPATIDEALDFAHEQLGVTVPLADILAQNPYESLLPPEQPIKAALYVGVESVRGRPCHHLAVSLEHLDWQLWIEDGEMFVPRKMVLTYTQEPSQPQYTIVFTSWNLSPRLPDVLFRFLPPEGANEIAFLGAEERKAAPEAAPEAVPKEDSQEEPPQERQ